MHIYIHIYAPPPAVLTVHIQKDKPRHAAWTDQFLFPCK